MSAGPRILIVRFSSLGDVVLITPLLRAIRHRWPQSEITLVTKLAFAPVVTGNPHVSRLITLAPGETLGSLVGRLRRFVFDYRLDLHGSLRSHAVRRALGGRWRGYGKRRLARRLMIWTSRRAVVPPRAVAERYFEAARELDVSPDGGPAEVFPAPADTARAAEIVRGDYVVVAPGACHATKRWPPAQWRALTAALAARGRQMVALGDSAERELVNGPGVVEAYGTGLGTAAALLRGARAAVCHDSGLMHLATAVGTPVVALFGPTVPEFGFAPYRARHVVVERPLGCRPCSPFGGPRCPKGHHRCLRDIDPADVMTALEAVA